MFNKHLLTLAILASTVTLSEVRADELPPVINNQTNLSPAASENTTQAPIQINNATSTPTTLDNQPNLLAAAPENTTPVQANQPTPVPTQTHYNTANNVPQQTQTNAPDDNRWYIAPYGTFVKTGGDRNAHDGWGGGLAAGKMINKHLNVEVKGFGETANGYNDPTRPNVGGSWKLQGATADVQYYPMRGKFSPYAVVGVGGMNTDVPDRSGASFIGEAGAGFNYEINDKILVRSDVRYRYNQNFNAHLKEGTDEYHDMTVNVGFVMPLGDKPKAPESIALAPAPVPQPIVADCSTLDADGDGVNNCVDKCPNTLAGSKVDNTGCPVSLELKGVNFKYDSAELTQNAMIILDGVAQNLINYPEQDDIEVRGHTSSEGTDAYNMRLSQQRSQSVANYLKSKGVRNRMIAKGYGERQPIANNNTELGKQQNRRVELIWLGN
ncbi:Outer membrane porin F [Patescibacteria group bacterium]|nr:Outer membrane porin F [Patescibacteria group bacterium]